MRYEGDASRVTCRRCGTFEITSTAWALYAPEESKPALDRNRYLLSGRARRATVEKRIERFDEKDLGRVERGEVPVPPVDEKIRLMLDWFERSSEAFGDWIAPVSSTDYPVAYCVDEHEWTRLLLAAGKRGWLEADGTGQRFHLTLDGRDWLRGICQRV
ncbi:MAG: hypothetical protein ABUR63_00935 [Verrucomicrobiota bacterium]